jgi:hypothetical protein
MVTAAAQSKRVEAFQSTKLGPKPRLSIRREFLLRGGSLIQRERKLDGKRILVIMEIVT